MKEISKLIDLGNRPLLDSSIIDPTIELPIPDHQRTQLLEMLSAKNGFYAFYASLHVFPIGKNAEHMDLMSWNEPTLWKEAYEFLTRDIFCFAEDILGSQFCVYDDGVGRFDPETGEIEYLAEDIEGWAGLLVSDAREAGYPWAMEWQKLHGSLPPVGYRLMMNQPAMCGGEFEARNMRSVKAVDAMRFWGTFATLTRDIPDGTPIEIDLVRMLPDGTIVKTGSIPQ